MMLDSDGHEIMYRKTDRRAEVQSSIYAFAGCRLFVILEGIPPQITNTFKIRQKHDHCLPLPIPPCWPTASLCSPALIEVRSSMYLFCKVHTTHRAWRAKTHSRPFATDRERDRAGDRVSTRMRAVMRGDPKSWENLEKSIKNSSRRFCVPILQRPYYSPCVARQDSLKTICDGERCRAEGRVSTRLRAVMRGDPKSWENLERSKKSNSFLGYRKDGARSYIATYKTSTSIIKAIFSVHLPT